MMGLGKAHNDTQQGLLQRHRQLSVTVRMSVHTNTMKGEADRASKKAVFVNFRRTVFDGQVDVDVMKSGVHVTCQTRLCEVHDFCVLFRTCLSV
jgi:hypothetical protein